MAASWGYVALYLPDDVQRLSRLGEALAVLAQANRDIRRLLLTGQPDVTRVAVRTALNTQQRVVEEAAELVRSIDHDHDHDPGPTLSM